MVSSFLALLLFISIDLPLGSRAAAPIGDEVLYNGEIFPTYIRPSIHPSVCPSVWLNGPEGGTDGRTDGHTYGKSPHSTGLRPLSGPLPCFPKEDLRQ